MSVSHEQLSEISRQLKEYFISHPAISFRPSKGDPPDQYEITYNIAGFSKPGTGEPALTSGHVVEMTLPFGFPHFPPSCKPKSAIYHPDFDPAAICLGDFWEQTGQLPELIIFIGKLINGESYSTANAFNEEAAVWYQDHAASFPIAQIDWSDRPPPPSPVPADKHSRIDTLDDADLSPDFNFLALDATTSDENIHDDRSTPEGERPADIDLGFLQLLENQKKFYKLREILRENPSSSPATQKISRHTEEAIAKAEELQRNAKKLEKQGELRKALRVYDQVFSVIVDFPHLEAEFTRVQHAISLLDETSKVENPADEAAKFTGKSEQLENDLPAPKPPAKRKEVKDNHVSPVTPQAPFAEKAGGSGKLMISLLIGGLFVILGFGGFTYLSSLNRLGTAETAFNLCSTLLEKGQFAGAKESCESGLAALQGVKFINQEKVKLLGSGINKILQSEQLTQGLAGNVLVDGKYLPQKDVDALSAFNRLIKEGEEFFKQENWEKAAANFTDGLNTAARSSHIPASAIDEIKGKLAITKFRKEYHSATTLLASSKWREAATELKKVQTLLTAPITEKDQKFYTGELRSALARCTFEDFRSQGDDYFAKSEWLNALSAYNSALLAADQGYAVPKDIAASLQENITRSELYTSIDKGNKAFASVSMDEAIKEYNKAGAILNDSRGVLKLSDAKSNRRKIDRIVLQAAIIRDRQAAKIEQEEKKDLAAAMRHYQQIVAAINNSAFGGEGEFAQVKKDTVAAIQGLEAKIYEADKEQYLKDNFKTIFVGNYPTAIPENLINPVINYVREVDGKMIFKMQCTDSGGSRPLTLVMFYSYEKTTNRWHLFAENQ
jgi:ubiquitin-protein ligase